MALTAEQKATLAADVAANSAEFGSLPQNSDGAFVIAAALNTLSETLKLRPCMLETREYKR